MNQPTYDSAIEWMEQIQRKLSDCDRLLNTLLARMQRQELEWALAEMEERLALIQLKLVPPLVALAERRAEPDYLGYFEPQIALLDLQIKRVGELLLRGQREKDTRRQGSAIAAEAERHEGAGAEKGEGEGDSLAELVMDARKQFITS